MFAVYAFLEITISYTQKHRKFYRVVEPRTKNGRCILVRRLNRRALCVAQVVAVCIVDCAGGFAR